MYLNPHFLAKGATSVKRKIGIYFFAGGLLLVILQFVTLITKYINYDSYIGDQIVYVAKDLSIGDFLSNYWSGLVGTLLLIVIFFRRLSRGPEAMMVLVGALLWVIQILSMHNAELPLIDFIMQYFIGIMGIAGVAIAGFYDAYLIKSQAPEEPDGEYNTK